MRSFSTTVAAASVLLALMTASAEAASCAALLRQGGKVIDSYVMDFGPSDKLYVYIVRMRSGATEKCTSERPLRTQRR